MPSPSRETTIVITAPWDRDIRGYRAGSAYVFTRPASGWVSTSESVKLTAPDGWATYWSRNDFGSSVAVMGDKVVIGAPGYYSVTSGAYVFTKAFRGMGQPVYRLQAHRTGPRTVLLFRRIGFDER